MKILLIGCNGQLGWELQRACMTLGQVMALDYPQIDIRQSSALRELIRSTRPDVLLNPAAYTNVEKAESDREAAVEVNAKAPGVMAEEMKKLGGVFIHYSTDYVFDGKKNAPYVETDDLNPLNEYGSSKLAGEQAVQAAGGVALIFRTSWVYAARGGNFAKTMLRLAKERERLTVINDQFGAPTGAELLADVTAHAIRATLADAGKSGLYHLVAGGETTWHGYARFVLEQASAAGVALKAPPEAVDPVPTSAFPTPATRPHNSRLNTQKLQSTFGLTLPHWQAGVARMLRETL